jgi:hypothetical protein
MKKIIVSMMLLFALAGPAQAGELSAQQVARITALQQQFAEVDPSSLEQWLDNFKRDRDPDRELAIWERIALVYTNVIAGRSVSAEYKQEVFKLLVGCSMMPRKDVLNNASFTILSDKDARAIMNLFYQ